MPPDQTLLININFLIPACFTERAGTQALRIEK
jgi:hypothetical protein